MQMQNFIRCINLLRKWTFCTFDWSVLWLYLKCLSWQQFQHWGKKRHHSLKVHAVAEATNIQYFTIAFWNHLKYLNYLCAALFSPSFFLFVFVVLCTDVSAVYYPQPDWYRVCILSPEHSRKAHAQSSFNMCSNPCSSRRLNGS